jgi:hypothetical protein
MTTVARRQRPLIRGFWSLRQIRIACHAARGHGTRDLLGCTAMAATAGIGKIFGMIVQSTASETSARHQRLLAECDERDSECDNGEYAGTADDGADTRPAYKAGDSGL